MMAIWNSQFLLRIVSLLCLASIQNSFAFVLNECRRENICVRRRGITVVAHSMKSSFPWTALQSGIPFDDSNTFPVSSSESNLNVSDFSPLRRNLLIALSGGGTFGWSMLRPNPAWGAFTAEEDALPVLKTSSGLKYIDLIPGTGISPSYGNVVSIAYTAFVKLPNNDRQYPTEPQRFDHSDAYLIKHGNGRMIAGLDEGIHTMKVGGTRRILVPPKLGFVDIGLGPLPDLPWDRYKLNQLLDQMVELSGGTVIYEVTLRSVIPDEADLGYYSDASLSPEDFNTLRENLRVKGNEGRIQEQAAAAAATTKGQDRVL